MEQYRDQWEPAAWFLKPEHRFVADNRSASLLTGAAALLSIAAKSTSNIVCVLPARCHVFHESILDAALDLAVSQLSGVAEGVATLAMIDVHEGIDEDYLVASRAHVGPGFTVQGLARRPNAWIARRLREQGVMIASGIMIGYAGTFAAHISKHWPGLTQELLRLVNRAGKVRSECEVPMDLPRGVPKTILKSLRWQPPLFPQRAFCVRGCGWSGMRSAHAVATIGAYLSTDWTTTTRTVVEAV